MAQILEALIVASERAALVARSCCTGSSNDTLLVAEKCEGEANARFDRDFKTIADVLAQESARKEIANRCPELADYVRGEESAEIGGIGIKVEETFEKTVTLLSALVPSTLANKMSEAVHCEISLPLGDEIIDLPPLNCTELGVWIDPIDATAEFIAGVRDNVQADGDTEHGLTCVTVLIGAYDKSTGEPVMGVINQPFFNNGKGRLIWGVSYGGFKKLGGTDVKTSQSKTILMSAAERPAIADKFKQTGWEVKSVPGAGHKLLKVVLGEANAYIVSKGTTFRWDSCAPHAILRARNGDVLSYTTHKPIVYNDPINMDNCTQMYSNSEGIIAFSDLKVLDEIKNVLV